MEAEGHENGQRSVPDSCCMWVSWEEGFGWTLGSGGDQSPSAPSPTGQPAGPGHSRPPAPAPLPGAELCEAL